MPDSTAALAEINFPLIVDFLRREVMQIDIDLVATPIVILDVLPTGEPQCVAFNRAAEQASGLGREEVIGKNARQVMPNRLGDTVYAKQIEAIKTGKPITIEMVHPLYDEETRVTCTFNPVKNEAGDVIRLIESFTIEAINKVADDNDQNTKTALRADIEKFVAMAAHDLRTPMHHVAEIAKLLEEDFQNQKGTSVSLIKTLQEIASKSNEMVSEVLSYSQMIDIAPTYEEFSLDRLCHEIASVLDPSHEHQISWPRVDLITDKTTLRLVIRNLFDNSMKYSGLESTKIDLTVKENGEDELCFCVRDNGKGFLYPENVFNSRADYRFGSGFGLHGVQRLINSIGGNIKAVQPSDGNGSLIIFSVTGKMINCGDHPCHTEALTAAAE